MKVKLIYVYAIAFLIMFAIACITYVIAHNVNSNPFYNH